MTVFLLLLLVSDVSLPLGEASVFISSSVRGRFSWFPEDVDASGNSSSPSRVVLLAFGPLILLVYFRMVCLAFPVGMVI